MPSMNKTPTIGLNQWTGNEFPKREDFAADNATIDAAVKSLREAGEALGPVLNALNGQQESLGAAQRAAFDFDNLVQHPGGRYTAAESGGVWTETIRRGSAVYATRTSTPTSTGWTVRTVCGACGIDKTVTYVENDSGWAAVVN